LLRQPWEGLAIEVTTENPRRPWKKEELEVLFSSPLHMGYQLPTNKDGGRDAAYWIPLLALFTGARAGELCQLQTKDVQEIEGIPVLRLTDDGEDQKIKSDAGHRTIPLHSELIRLGFLDYVECVRKKGSVSLWPELPLRAEKPSDYFGRWFLEHRVALGLQGKGGPSMHFFRHTVRPLMRRAGFSSAVQDKITGHETRGSIGDVVYDHVMMEELQPAVEAIRYPYLNLPRVFKG
jgi:integrase